MRQLSRRVFNAVALTLVLAVGCGQDFGPGNQVRQGLHQAPDKWKYPYGRWEGWAYISETPMKDEHRNLTRESKARLTFDVLPNDVVSGTIAVTYDAKLYIKGLPQRDVGLFAFAPNVGGKVVDPSPTRTFRLFGQVYPKPRHEMSLSVALPLDTKPITFLLAAGAGVSAPLLGLLPLAKGQTFKKIDMKPWDPLGTEHLGKMKKSKSGPWMAGFRTEPGEPIKLMPFPEDHSKYKAWWFARQVSAIGKDATFTPPPDLLADPTRSSRSLAVATRSADLTTPSEAQPPVAPVGEETVSSDLVEVPAVEVPGKDEFEPDPEW